MYAGSRWAKGCHPNEFMQSNGYTTSSNEIHRIIQVDGIDSFEILRIDTNLDGLLAYEYETIFLQTIDASNSKTWYNIHNNVGKPPAYGTIEFSNMMIEKYGYDNVSKIPEIKTKIVLTHRNTMIEKYGVTHPSSIPEFLCKREVSRKYTMLKKYGVESPTQVPEILDKMLITLKDTLVQKYGVTNTMQIPGIRNKAKNTMTLNTIRDWGYDDINKVPFLSVIFSRKTYNKCTLTRYYPEFKQYY